MYLFYAPNKAYTPQRPPQSPDSNVVASHYTRPAFDDDRKILLVPPP